MRRIQLTSNFLPSNKKDAKSLSFGLIIEPPKINNIECVENPLLTCTTCGACYKNGTSCPICNVGSIKPISSCFVEEYCYRNQELQNKTRLICFIFDLSIPGALLQCIISSLMEDSFVQTLGNDKFILIFNEKNPIFICKKHGILHMQIGLVEDEPVNYIFPASSLPEIFEEVLVLISTFGFQTSTDKSISSIFDSLKYWKPEKIIFFYSNTIPVLQNIPYAVNCINVCSPSNKSHTPFSVFYANKFSMLQIQQTSRNINTYLSMILDKNIPSCYQTLIIVSNGLNIEWVSGPFEEICKRSRAIAIGSSFNHALNSIMCALSISGNFKNVDTFAVQITSQGENGSVYVANNYFRKAASAHEFDLSFNFYAYGIMHLRQSAVEYFASRGFFDRRFQWDSKHIPYDEDSKSFVRRLIKRFNGVISPQSPLTASQIEYFLFLINNLGISFISDVINNLIAPPNDEYILIPPFLFYVKDSKPEKHEDFDLLKGGAIIITEYLESLAFDRLLTIISMQ